MSPSRDSGTHVSGSCSSGTRSQTTDTSSRRHSLDEDVEGLPQDATSKKRKPNWLKELVKETEESVGPPRREVRERKALERFSNYMAQDHFACVRAYYL